MATYDYLSGGCKCISGYVFGEDFMGKTICVSGDSVCYDKYGYGSRYDSLSNSCECSYGYVLGKNSIGRTQCISEDQACKNQYGYNSRSSYGGKCECGYGYGFGTNALGETECVSLNSICTNKYGYSAEYNSLSDSCQCQSGYELTQKSYGSGLECKSCYDKYGLHSSYDYTNKKCGCDDGYTLKDGQCVEKQNNVYFILKELDTDGRRAIIKSDYDYRYYLISYNSGCYSSSFRRYLNHQIVVNLGTDFDLDTWDKIVLQDDDEVCDITGIERADSSTTLEPEEEEETFYFVPQPSTIISPQPTKNSVPTLAIKKEFQFDESKKKNFESKLSGEIITKATLRKCPSTIMDCDVLRYLDSKTKVDIIGSYNNEEWFQINVIDTEQVLSGWIHSSIINKIIVPQTIEPTNEKKQETAPWYKKIFEFFSRLFK